MEDKFKHNLKPLCMKQRPSTQVLVINHLLCDRQNTQQFTCIIELRPLQNSMRKLKVREVKYLIHYYIVRSGKIEIWTQVYLTAEPEVPTAMQF